MAKEMPLPPNEMIDWYKEIVAKRESEAEKMKAEHREEIAELKAEHKQYVAEIKSEHREALAAKQKANVMLSIATGIMLLAIAVLVVIDMSVAGMGWIR